MPKKTGPSTGRPTTRRGEPPPPAAAPEDAGAAIDLELDAIRRKRLAEIAEAVGRAKATAVDATVGGKPLVSRNDVPIELTDQTFDATIGLAKAAMVDCWAEWCHPCKMIEPIVEYLAKQYAGRALMGRIDIEANKDIPMRFQVHSIPTMLFFANGQYVDRIVGAVRKPVLARALDELIRISAIV